MILSGILIAQSLMDELTIRVYSLWQEHHIIPHLAVIRVGEDEATSSYIKQKEKMAKQIGCYVSVYTHPIHTTQEEIMTSIDFLTKEEGIHGIIVQLPLPAHIDGKKLIEKIPPQKDIDGFHPHSPFIVPIAKAVMRILEVAYKKQKDKPPTIISWLSQQNIVVIGKGKTGGQPIIDYLTKTLSLTITVIDSTTLNPHDVIKQADIIISAVGKKNLLTPAMLKKDVILLGIGMNKGETEFFGDYTPEDISTTASLYTPIPGGVGPVNVACLLENLVIAAENLTKN